MQPSLTHFLWNVKQHGGSMTCIFTFGMMAINDGQLELCVTVLTCLQIMHEMLFINQHLQT
jgi:hypothetical protein